MSKRCEDCGSIIDHLGCTWCNEDAYIEEQRIEEEDGKHK